MAETPTEEKATEEKVLKKQAPKPRHLLASEAIALKLYPIGKESAQNRLKHLDSQIEVVTLTAELAVKKLKEEKTITHAHMSSEKTKFNALGQRLKDKYGDQQLRWDPETLEIGD